MSWFSIAADRMIPECGGLHTADGDQGQESGNELVGPQPSEPSLRP